MSRSLIYQARVRRLVNAQGKLCGRGFLDWLDRKVADLVRHQAGLQRRMKLTAEDAEAGEQLARIRR